MRKKGQYDTAKADHDEVITALTTAISKLSAISFLQAHSGKRAAVHLKGKQSPFSEVGDTGAGGAVDMLTDLLNKYTTARTQLIQEEDDGVAAHKQYLVTAEQFRTETTQTKQSLSSSKLLKQQREAEIQALKEALQVLDEMATSR